MWFAVRSVLLLSPTSLKGSRDKLWLVYTQSVPVIFEPPCTPPWSTSVFCVCRSTCTQLLFASANAGNRLTFVTNVGTYLPIYTASNYRRKQSSYFLSRFFVKLPELVWNHRRQHISPDVITWDRVKRKCPCISLNTQRIETYHKQTFYILIRTITCNTYWRRGLEKIDVGL
jgi:hypothetical protein